MQLKKKRPLWKDSWIFGPGFRWSYVTCSAKLHSHLHQRRPWLHGPISTTLQRWLWGCECWADTFCKVWCEQTNLHLLVINHYKSIFMYISECSHVYTIWIHVRTWNKLKEKRRTKHLCAKWFEVLSCWTIHKSTPTESRVFVWTCLLACLHASWSQPLKQGVAKSSAQTKNTRITMPEVWNSSKRLLNIITTPKKYSLRFFFEFARCFTPYPVLMKFPPGQVDKGRIRDT